MQGAIHDELLDAARIDGAGFFRQYWHVALPVSGPASAFLGIFTFMGLERLRLAADRAHRPGPRDPPGGAVPAQRRPGTTDYGMVMAGALLALVPLLIVFAIGARQIIGDLAKGAIKLMPTRCWRCGPWESPEVTSWGRLPMNAVDRRAGAHSLDGDWRFQLLPAPDAPVGGPWSRAAGARRWTMQTTHGHRRPAAVHQLRCLAGVPAAAPDANPTGVYERELTSPPSGRAAGSCSRSAPPRACCWSHVDGRAGRVSKDSHLAAEFDLIAWSAPGAGDLVG